VTKLTITPTSSITADVAVDGVEIGDAISGLTIGFQPNQSPRVIADLHVEVTPIELDNPRITVPAQTQKALEKLGWKSPEEAKALEVVVRTMVAEEIEAAHAKDPSCPDCCLPTAAQIARGER
jgi:hypothetical protein